MSRKNRLFASLANTINENGRVETGALSANVSLGISVDEYADTNAMPTSATLGDLALVTSTNSLYLYNGSAWFNIAMTNQAPTAITGNNASYELAQDGTPTVVTLASTDPEGIPLDWSATTSGDTGVATVTNTGSIFTITPSADTANAGTLSVTFSVTDGSNTESSTSSFTLAFIAFEQAQKITSPSVSTYADFGYDIEVDGSTMVVGAWGDNTIHTDHGSAWIYIKSGSTWILQDELDAPSYTSANRRFGWSVDISGDTAIVGATHEDIGGNDVGGAHIYTRSGSTWSLQQTIRPAGLSTQSFLGYDVAIDGDTAVVTTYPQGTNTESQRAYIYTRSGSTWSLQQTIDPVPNDGRNVTLSGDTLALGNIDTSSAGGDVSVYTRSGSTWSLQQTLTPSVNAQYHGGGGLVLDGDTLAVGAANYSSNTGAVFVYTRSGSTWTEQQIVTADTPVANSNFGGYFEHNCIGLKGDVMTVGAAHEQGDVGYQAGFTYVFERSGSTWSQTARLSPEDVVGHSTSDKFGLATAVGIDTVFVGAPGEDEDGTGTGAVYIYTRT